MIECQCQQAGWQGWIGEKSDIEDGEGEGGRQAIEWLQRGASLERLDLERSRDVFNDLWRRGTRRIGPDHTVILQLGIVVGEDGGKGTDL